eukprot:Unigene12240_Nuclearia_a/m.37198 Unigene12240_Nuclearia_a/g.37198  ORF Unigene12240_Nuclearia_a/g.37198 Unigene12240_Nuclearia_a/m.37198 type:complete len:206 (+) Unigene12240_Nuclearia_a:38-655(+)
MKHTLGVLLFDGFEVLDVYGPVECLHKVEGIRIVTVAERAGLVRSTQALETRAEYGLNDCPPLTMLIVPGGYGTRREVLNARLIAWIRERALAAELVMTVCTGTALLAKTRLLDGVRATSNKRSFAWVAQQGPLVRWVPRARWVEDGKWWTSSGVSAGTDMALQVIERLCGKAKADDITAQVEWDRKTDAAWDPFADMYGLAPKL